MPVDRDNLPDVLANIRKTYENTVFSGSDYDNPERLPFESPTLNWATGGGIPFGRFTRLVGPYSSGKTRLSYGALKAAQNAGLTWVFYNIEKQWDVKHLQNIGVDPDAGHVVHSSRIEEVGEIAEEMFSAAHVHVIDSCTSAESVDMLDADMADWQRGLKARAWNKVFGHWKDAIDDNDNILIFTDQVRIDQKNQGQEYAPGGKGLEHAGDLVLWLRKGSRLYHDGKGYLTDKKPDGLDDYAGGFYGKGRVLHMRVEKSRVCAPHRIANLHYDQDSAQFDVPWELMKWGLMLDIIGKKGSWYTIPVNGKKDLRFQGEAQLHAHIKQDMTLQEEITEELMAFDN